MSAKKIFVMGSMAVMGIAFMACSNESLYDEGAVIKEQEAEYAANFEKRYGKIDPNQSWDFTSGQTYASASLTSTRATAPGKQPSFDRVVGSLEINKEVSQWMLDYLPKGKNNTAVGKEFHMIIGENDFGIAPIFQGCASYYWELWMDVPSVGKSRVWSKGDNLKYKKPSDTNYTAVNDGTDGMKREWGACEVLAPTFTYNNLPAGEPMSFFLKVWTGGKDQYDKWVLNPNDPQNKPYETSSLSAWMLNLEDAPIPTKLPKDYTATIIGCEDKISGSDKDYEDLVFLLYGNPVPPTKRVDHKDVYKVKRYMMEDLGETDDFDFNDVVIDIYYDRVHYDYYFKTVDDTEPYKTVPTDQPNLGVVRAAGGILDFEVYVGGDMVWKKSASANVPDVTDMINTEPNHDVNYVLDTFIPTKFNAETNNISVKLKRGSSDKVWEIKFPEAGKAPKMITVDYDTNWMDERVKVPTVWFIAKP